MKNIKIVLPILLIILIIVVYWHANKSNEEIPGDNPDNTENVIDKENNVATSSEENSLRETINYLPNGEIDISDWLTYRNHYYGMTIKYPPFLVVNNVDSVDFKFGLKSDFNYHYYSGEITYFDQMKLYTLDDRVEYVRKQYSDDPYYKEIKVENEYVYYSVSKSKGGYYPRAVVLSNEKAFWITKDIESQTPEFKEYDPKYIDIFKASLKTIKFDN